MLVFEPVGLHLSALFSGILKWQRLFPLALGFYSTSLITSLQRNPASVQSYRGSTLSLSHTLTPRPVNGIKAI